MQMGQDRTMSPLRLLSILALPVLIAAAPAAQRWAPGAESIAAFRAGDMARRAPDWRPSWRDARRPARAVTRVSTC